jgi:putative Mg2+ transporter-C (MgtC) family protein
LGSSARGWRAIAYGDELSIRIRVWQLSGGGVPLHERRAHTPAVRPSSPRPKLGAARPRPIELAVRAGSISDGEILLRLAAVVVLCAAIGLERQARDQIAGLRTHVIVGLGAGLFTLVSAYGFTGSHFDPTRIAAQVVSGIGFLGGGVILRYGVTVRGVTTAAALWISAAIGMATAVGFYVGAVATTVIALVVLVALRRLKPVVRRRLAGEAISLRVDLVPGASIRSLLGQLRRRNLRVEGLESQILDDGSERLQLDVRGPASLDVDDIVSALAHLDAVARIDLALMHSPDLDADEDGSPPRERHRRRFMARSSMGSATESTTRDGR